MQPLILKLEQSEFLDDTDKAMLQDIAVRPRIVEAHSDIIQEGDRPENVHLVIEGFAYRYKVMPGNRRQIMALLLPGDFCDLNVAILGQMDHSIAALSTCRIVDISRTTVLECTTGYPGIAHAFWWATLVDEGILREWLANIGQRPADRRMAHLFLELHVRLLAVGRASDSGFDLPVSQREIGDILGLSLVHTNKTLRVLRETGLVMFRDKRIEILDQKRLVAFCEFNPNYLHSTPRLSNAPEVQ